jgi:hypothetical protein
MTFMSRIVFLFFLELSCATSLDSSSIRARHNNNSPREMTLLDDPQNEMDRNLAVTLDCSDDGAATATAGPDDYFTVNINMTPRGGSNLGTCSSELLKSIGATLNVILDDYGFGIAGEGDQAVFSATVCDVPSSSLSGRRLPLGFNWAGDGVCKSCGIDNGDGRMLKTSENDGTWFSTIYAPELKKKLEKGIAKSLPSSTRVCLGSAPSVIVTIYQVTGQPNVYCGR